MAEAYDPDTPSEVGKIMFSDDSGSVHVGMISVSGDTDAPPIHVIDIPVEIRDEFEFVFLISPQTAYFFHSIQAENRGVHVDDSVLVAANIIWWLSVRVGTMLWKELHDDKSN
jgi:hypothetical protein